jgi:hypothetical protein
MGRYFRFDGNTFDFATRCDVTERREYFNEFTFGGQRDQRIYGLSKVTPMLTAEYDVNGLYFLRNVLGTLSATIPSTMTIAEVPEIGTISADIDGIYAGITQAKVDTWNFTVEENGPARVEFAAIGKGFAGTAPTAYTADFCSTVVMPYNVGVTVNTSSIGFTRFNLNVNNALTPIFKNATLPQTIRATGLEVDGKIRVADYKNANIADGSLCVVVSPIGTIYIPTIKVTEIPSRARGFDLPEAEYSFIGFPSCTDQAIKAVLGTTIKW